MDCILGYHLNPMSCGIAKFNQHLANKLAIPLLSLFDPEAQRYQRPLLSIKTAEFHPDDLPRLRAFLEQLPSVTALRLFLHDYVGTELEQALARRAQVIYSGNKALDEKLADYTHKLVSAWCPGSLLDSNRFHSTELSVLSFGMAHKLRAEHYRKLDRLLQATGKSYCLYISTALHEGTRLEDNFLEVFEEMRSMFSGEIYYLGCLSDTAVFNYLHDTTYFAAFFPGGVRANNTSVHTAMTQGSVVITNLDAYSPTCYRHLDSLIDIHACQSLPTDATGLQRIGDGAQAAARELDWQPLLQLIQTREQHM